MLNPKSQRFTPIFFFLLRGSYFKLLTFRSLSHFELIFTYGVRLEVQLQFFALRHSVVSATFVKETGLSLLNNLGTLVENQLTIDIYENSIPLIYISIYMPVPHSLDYCNKF